MLVGYVRKTTGYRWEHTSWYSDGGAQPLPEFWLVWIEVRCRNCYLWLLSPATDHLHTCVKKKEKWMSKCIYLWKDCVKRKNKYILDLYLEQTSCSTHHLTLIKQINIDPKSIIHLLLPRVGPTAFPNRSCN